MFGWIAGGAGLLVALIILIYKLEAVGRRHEQNDQMQQVLDDIHTADMARDRLDRDTDDARRVRERFTR
ncbi:MAG: hypothetical protein HY052_08005 [Proteobacteria bacterium]|nr:hypothetical protein [Pseudomonadota bacterium]